ncbi:hypothetical protein HOD08_02495 [bacterium]|nr:hypothetical protein [bacterium]
MKKIVLLAVAVFGWSSCRALDASKMWGQEIPGSGKAVTVEHKLDEVSKVKFEIPGILVVEQGNEDRIFVSADDNLINLIKLNVKDGELCIALDLSDPIRPASPMQFHLFVNKLSDIKIVGGSQQVEVGAIKNRDFGVELVGSGTVHLVDVEASRFKVKVQGTGNVLAEVVKSNNVKLDIVGEGGIGVKNVFTNKLKIESAGSGKIGVRGILAKELEADVKGAGFIECDGRADLQDIKFSGAITYRAQGLFAKDTKVKLDGANNIAIYTTGTLEVDENGSNKIDSKGNPKVVNLNKPASLKRTSVRRHGRIRMPEDVSLSDEKPSDER